MQPQFPHEPNLPPPSGNPLDMEHNDPMGQRPASRAQDPYAAQLPPEDSHETLQRGMPARTIKTWAVATMGVVVAGALLWPSSDNGPQGPRNVAPTNNSIADELAARVQPKMPDVRIEAPPPPLPPSVPAAKPSGDDERMAMILASPMGAEVEIGTGKRTPKNPDRPGTDVDMRGMMRESSARAEAMLDRMRENQASARAVEARQPDAHQQFLSEARSASAGPQEAAMQLASARKPNTIYEGTLIRTVLTRELRTDLPGTITAKVMSDVYDSVTMNTLLIPRGSEVICSYQSELLVGQEVVLAACNRLRLPNGKSFSLLGTPAANLQGASGLPANVNNHFWKTFGSSLLLGAASLLLKPAERTVTVATGAGGGTEKGGTILGTTLQQSISNLLARNTRIAPTAEVEIGTPFTLTVARDVEMEPYSGR